MLNKPISPWWTVAAGAAASAFGSGTIMVYAFGILSLGLTSEFGWSPATVASLFTAFLAGSGIGFALLGRWISRAGIRLPSALFAMIFGLTFSAVGIMPPSPPWFALLFLIIGISGAACTVLPYTVAVAGFFDGRRGLALGIVVAGSGIGAFALPQIARHASAAFGWRGGFALIGFLAAFLPLIALTFFVRTPPGMIASRTRNAGGVDRRTIAQIYLANRSFWLILAAILPVSVAAFGGMSSLVPLFTGRGFSSGTVATILSVVGLASWIGRLAVGYLLDRVFAPYLTAGVMLLAAAGLMILILADSPWAACVGAICVSLALGAEADMLSFLVSRYFPLKEFSQVTGLIWVVWAWSGGVGAALAAGAVTQYQSYGPALAGFAILLLAGAFLICRLGAYRNPVHSSTETALAGS